MRATMPVKTETLHVPGASLYYEVRGSGPVLLMMPGGPADAAAFAKIAGHLAAHYTVVTYDPRGLSHSTLDGALDQERLVEVFADDVHRLLAAASSEKACVFASSGGAVIALELAARHPEQLDTVVLHEPPSPSLQPDPAEAVAEMEEVSRTYTTEGFRPAIEKFTVLTRSGPPPAQDAEPTPEEREVMAQMMRNMDIFFGPYMLGIALYQPDFDALKRASCRIVPAIGDESRGEFAYEGGVGLARILGKQATVFPGAHGAFDTHAAEFAVRLRDVLQG